MRRRCLAALLGVVMVTAGCSDPATLDHDGTERAVVEAVAARVKPKVRSASCPDHIRQADGEVTRCTVGLAAGLGRVRVLVRQVDGDGHLTVTLQDAILTNATVGKDLEAKLASSFGRTFTATCGAGYRVLAPGTSFRCQADDGNGARQVTVTVRDPSGTVTYDVST